MQDGNTPAIVASINGHTETLALLLANKADVNSADKVQKFKLLIH
jgi:ankyrin repeat protein